SLSTTRGYSARATRSTTRTALGSPRRSRDRRLAGSASAGRLSAASATSGSSVNATAASSARTLAITRPRRPAGRRPWAGVAPRGGPRGEGPHRRDQQRPARESAFGPDPGAGGRGGHELDHVVVVRAPIRHGHGGDEERRGAKGRDGAAAPFTAPEHRARER